MVWRGLPQTAAWERGGPSTAHGLGRSWTQNRRRETTLTHWVWLQGHEEDKMKPSFSITPMHFHRTSNRPILTTCGPSVVPEVLCAVLVREPLWLEARMDDQALLEGIVVFSDEDGPEQHKEAVSHINHDQRKGKQQKTTSSRCRINKSFTIQP